MSECKYIPIQVWGNDLCLPLSTSHREILPTPIDLCLEKGSVYCAFTLSQAHGFPSVVVGWAPSRRYSPILEGICHQQVHDLSYWTAESLGEQLAAPYLLAKSPPSSVVCTLDVHHWWGRRKMLCTCRTIYMSDWVVGHSTGKLYGS